MVLNGRAVVDRPSVDNFVDNDFFLTCRQGSCTGDNIKFEKHWKNQRHRTCSTWDKRQFSYVWALKLHHKTLIWNLVYCYFLPCMQMACCNVFFLHLVKLLIYFHIISHNFVISSSHVCLPVTSSTLTAQESSVQRRLATPSDTSLCTDCAIPDTACMQRDICAGLFTRDFSFG